MEYRCFISRARIPEKDRVPGLYYYAMRHTDGDLGFIPYRGYTLERWVLVNHYADVVTNFQVNELIVCPSEPKPYMSVAKFFRNYTPTKVKSVKEVQDGTS